MPSFIEHLSHTTRSYRRFRSIYRVPEGHMKKWVDNTRYTASAKNLQPLRYRIVSDREMCAKVYDTLAWAGYLTDWEGPEEKERSTLRSLRFRPLRLTWASARKPLCLHLQKKALAVA